MDNLDLLKALLAHGADPNARLKTPLLARYHNTGDGQLGAGATPLMRAAKSVDVPGDAAAARRRRRSDAEDRTGTTRR